MVIETLTQYGRQTVMAQRYIPEIVKGDKRIIVIDGMPAPILPRPHPEGWRDARQPRRRRPRRRPSAVARDREIAEARGEVLAPEGLLLVGLDVIGDYLTEVNVTSPTGMREISDQTGFNVAGMMVDAVEKSVGQRHPA